MLEAEVFGLVIPGLVGRLSPELMALSGSTGALFTWEFLTCSSSCLLFCRIMATTSLPSLLTQCSQYETLWSKVSTWSRRIFRCARNDVRNLFSQQVALEHR